MENKSINKIKNIAILGGSGFVGRSLANRLVKEGYTLRILTRNREQNRKDLILLPGVELVESDIHNPDQLTIALAGCDAAINLIGILNEVGRRGKGFEHAHVELTRKLIQACQANNIKRLLQMSSLNADPVNGKSHYLRSKGQAEELAHSAKGIHTTSFQPSIIFGRDDSFFNRFAALLKMTPLFFPLACAQARFAPVFVNDVVEAFALSLSDPHSFGKRYQLCGPEVYSFKQLLEYTLKCTKLRRYIMPLPDFLARLQAHIFDLCGFFFHILGMEKPFSMDNYLSAQHDSVCECNHLAQLGITPTSIKSVVPKYLSGKTRTTRYSHFRQSARR